MRWALPRLRMRFRLRGLCVLVALVALGMWGGLFFLSPTRRLTRQIQPDQPTYLRREAVGGLGYVPFWEADQAIDILIEALGDPSPRVRENALGGLGRTEFVPVVPSPRSWPQGATATVMSATRPSPCLALSSPRNARIRSAMRPSPS